MDEMEIDNIPVGNKISHYRKENELTQKQLGTKLGKSKDYISNLERGVVHPSLELLSDLAEVFNISIDELLSTNILSHPAIEIENYEDDLTNEFASLLSVVSTKRKEKILETVDNYIKFKDFNSK